jgi:hypothetical protein
MYIYSAPQIKLPFQKAFMQTLDYICGRVPIKGANLPLKSNQSFMNNSYNQG